MTMYEKPLQLKKRPFTTAAIPEHWCDAGNAGKVVQQIFQTLARSMGISVLVGAPGTGKSMTLALLARQYAEQQHEVVQLVASRLDHRRDVLQRILFELNIPCRDMTESDLRLTLIQHLRSICGQHARDVLLLVDEAHNLSVDLLDELRIVAESASRNQGRCHLVLAGTPRLEEHLNHTDLEQFNQRIACRVYLQPMTREETANYVRQHLQRAGGGRREYFGPDALKELSRTTGGIPRLVNQVCDQCLLALASSGQPAVTAAMVIDAWCDIQNLPRQSVEATEATPGRPVTASATGTVEFGTLDDEAEKPARPRSRAAKTRRNVSQAEPIINELDRLRAELHETLAKSGRPEQTRAQSTRPGRPHTSQFDESFDSEERVLTALNRGAAGAAGQTPLPNQAGTAPPEAGWTVSTSLAASIADVERALAGSDTGGSGGSSGMKDFPAFSGQSNVGSETPRRQEITLNLASGVEASSRVVPVAFPVPNPSAANQGSDADTAAPAVRPTIRMPGTETKPANENRKPVGADDRDILIAGDLTCFEPTRNTGEIPDNAEDAAPAADSLLKGPHAAKAKRMEYRQLFAQLRDGSPH